MLLTHFRVAQPYKYYLLFYLIIRYCRQTSAGPYIISITHKWAPPPPAPLPPDSTAGAPQSAPKCTVQCSPQHCSGNGDLLAGGGGNYYFGRIIYDIFIYFPPALWPVYELILVTKYKASIVQYHRACHYIG